MPLTDEERKYLTMTTANKFLLVVPEDQKQAACVFGPYLSDNIEVRDRDGFLSHAGEIKRCAESFRTCQVWRVDQPSSKPFPYCIGHTMIHSGKAQLVSAWYIGNRCKVEDGVVLSPFGDKHCGFRLFAVDASMTA